jgi:hypothetical protein
MWPLCGVWRPNGRKTASGMCACDAERGKSGAQFVAFFRAHFAREGVDNDGATSLYNSSWRAAA